MVTTFISHWSELVHDLVERMDEAVTSSLATGDMKPAIALCFSTVRLCAGDHLEDLALRYEAFRSTLQDLKKHSTESWLLPAYQPVRIESSIRECANMAAYDGAHGFRS
jgi:1-deoxy-D-xylulose 5-phosphate reductoisomerase